MNVQAVKKKPKGDYTVDSKERYLITGGGKIRCLRCTASSTRSKLQCAKPALKLSTTQKCGHHGGRPHSTEILRRIAEANILHGECSSQSKAQYRQDAAHIRHLEDAVHLLQLGKGPKMRGRKPAGYRGVFSEADVLKVVSERLLHPRVRPRARCTCAIQRADF